MASIFLFDLIIPSVFIIRSISFSLYFAIKSYSKLLDSFIDLKKKYQTLKKEKQMLKIVDDYLLEYDGDYFDLHKPSDIRSLVYLFNRCNGFSELECEYNKRNDE